MIRNRLRTLPPLFTVTTLLVFQPSLHADLVRWDGGAGTENWADAANWSDDALPGEQDDVAFVNSPDATLDVHLGADRTIANILNTGSDFFPGKRLTIGTAADVAAGRTFTLAGGRIDMGDAFGGLVIAVDLTLGRDSHITSGTPTRINGVVRDGGAGYGLHSFGHLTLAGANTYSGLTSSDERITLQGPNGSIRNSPGYSGLALVMENSLGANNDRVNDNATITLRGNGGFLALTGHPTQPVTETVGDVVLAGGYHSISAARPYEELPEVLLRIRSLTRQNHAVAHVDPAGGRIILLNTPSLVGAGAPGTAGAGIVPYLLGEDYDSGPATYDPGPDAVSGNADDVGFRPLRPSERTSLEAAATGDNVRIAGTAPESVSGKTINSLSIGESTSGSAEDMVITGTGTLAIRSGHVSVERGGSHGKAIISGFDGVDFGPAEAIVHNAVGSAFTASFEIASPVRGSGGLTKAGYGGVRLTGPHDYSGTVTILEGSLDVDYPTGLGSGGEGVIIDGGELGIVSSFTTDRRIATGSEGGGIRVDQNVTFTLSAPIVLDGHFSKRGSGTLVLAAPSDWPQRNFVVLGTLVVANASGSATGDALLYVQDRATLAGAGTARGRVTVYGGGRVAPGTTDDAVAALTIGDLVLRDGSSLRFDLADPQHSDRLLVNGDLTLDGTLFVTALDTFGPGAYRVIDYAGSLTDYGLSVRGASDYQYQIDTSTPGQVNLIVLVPEPASLAAVGLVLSLLRRRR